MNTNDCSCGREHVRTKAGVLLSLDNEPGTNPELTANLKRTLEDPTAAEAEGRHALRRYLFG